MRLSLWLKGSLSTPDRAAAPAGVAIEALVTDCTNRHTCPVGSTVTGADGGFELRVDAEVDAQLGRMPGESSALFVQARNGGDLVATANVCWVEDLPAGRAVELALVAARAVRGAGATAPPRPVTTVAAPRGAPGQSRLARPPATLVPRPQAAAKAPDGPPRRNVLGEFLAGALAPIGVG